MFSPKFQIQEMTIAGNENISTETIEKIAEEKIKVSFSFLGMDFATESIFLSLGKRIEELKKDLPEIEQVSIKKNFPHGISINIIEKVPFAIWTDEKGEYFVDKKGSFIKNTEQETSYGDFIRVKQIEHIDDLNKKEILNCFQTIKAKIANEVIKVSCFELYENKVKVIANKNIPIVFDLKQDLDWQIEKLLVVLSKKIQLDNFDQIEYIDLRFDNQTVIKKIN